MLTAKENMRAAVLGGKPDRYVNQYEAISLLFHPAMMTGPRVVKGGPDVVLSRCTKFRTDEGDVPMTDELRAKIMEQNKAMAR